MPAAGPTEIAPPPPVLAVRRALVTGGAGGIGLACARVLDDLVLDVDILVNNAGVVETVLLAESSIERLVEPTEVASLVGWLVGADSSIVTGASYSMDVGWMAR